MSKAGIIADALAVCAKLAAIETMRKRDCLTDLEGILTEMGSICSADVDKSYMFSKCQCYMTQVAKDYADYPKDTAVLWTYLASGQAVKCGVG